MRRPSARVLAAGVLACCSAERPAEHPARNTMTAQRHDSLEVELHAPSEVKRGEPVPITLRLTNSGARPLELHLQGRDIVFDIVVRRENGVVVWRRLAGAAVQGILQIKTLSPGEILELKDTWLQRDGSGKPIPAGNYEVQGVLPTDDPEPLRTPVVSLRIVPR